MPHFFSLTHFKSVRILNFEVISTLDPIQIQQKLLQSGSSPIQVQSNAHLWIQDVTNDGVLLFSLLWFLYSQKIKMILSVCAALITVDDNSCYVIVNIFLRGGSSVAIVIDCSLSHPTGHKQFTCSHCVCMYHVSLQSLLVLDAFFCLHFCACIYNLAESCMELLSE